MANSFAYAALFAWPLVVFLIFRRMERPVAVAWSIIGGYLLLPHGVGINLPALPTLDKTLIPAFSAALMCLLGVGPAPAIRRGGNKPSPEAQVIATGKSAAFTRQGVRRQTRTAVAPTNPDAATFTVTKAPRIITLLVVLLLASPILTYWQNTEPYQSGLVNLPGLRFYDACSMMLSSGVMLVPFFLGQRFFGAPAAQATLLRVICLSALAYSLLALFEVRMSPQLARWTYGFLAQSFAQAVRDGGFRPVVYLQHGLWLAIFLTMAALAAVALWRNERAEGRPSFMVWAGLWLSAVLVLCNSLGALVLLLLFLPVVLLLPARTQLGIAAVLAVIMLVYPMLRGAGLVPVDDIYTISASLSEERAGSLKFRLDNEDRLLDRASQKPLFGWGGYGRSLVFNEETGRNISVTDGMWVIVMGVSGWLGYLTIYGLLTLPVILLFLRQRILSDTHTAAGLCVMAVANLVDMIANATLTPVTWLIAGALAGRSQFSLVSSGTADTVTRRRREKVDIPASARGKRSVLQKITSAVLLSVMFAPAIMSPAKAGVSSPTLSFGLTGISDWSTQMPFLDLMKMSRPWIGHQPGKWGGVTVEQLEAGGYLDADGWPTHIPDGLASIGTIWDWGSSAADPAAAASRAGTYVLTYEGEGSLQFSGNVKVLSSEPGRIVVQNLNGGTMMLNITATDPGRTGDYIRDISLVAQEHEALHEAGQLFNPDWLALVQDARELRFMDWMKTNGTTQASWEDRPQLDDVTWANGAPVEVMVALANQTGTEPWFTMPAGADEAYIRKFATYVRDHLNPDLQAHVEYSNEMWNWSFGQTKWLGEQAKAVWATNDSAAWLDYAAMLATKSALIWDDVFGASADTRVDNIMGTQTANTWIASRLLTAPIWQSKDPSGYVSPASVFDSLAVTTYFGGWEVADPAQRSLLLAAIKDGEVYATAWLKARMLDPTITYSIPQIKAYWAANKAIADKYGLDLVAYEGGQHVLHSFAVSGISNADMAVLTTFLTGFVRSQAMAELYHELWKAWAAVSDGPFMQFGDVGAASKSGAWGLFSALGDNNPRANLLMDLNQNSTAWFD